MTGAAELARAADRHRAVPCALGRPVSYHPGALLLATAYATTCREPS